METKGLEHGHEFLRRQTAALGLSIASNRVNVRGCYDAE